VAIETIVFDFDGTLADSLAISVQIFQEISPSLGLKPFNDLEAARRLPTRQLLKELGISFWRLPKLVRAFQQAAAAHAPHLKLHPGIAELLPALRANGYHLGVLSSNREDNIRATLAANNVEELFEFVIGHPHLFGKARALRKLRKRLGAQAASLLYVGDEVRDVEASLKAGIAVAGCAWGFHARELLADANPTVMLDHPSELLRYLA
jgi:phosphoglycolate phosphatase